jgi:pimeloyl-ACP methyl ester carboxylesterase
MNITQHGNGQDTIIFIHGLAGNQNVFKREIEYFREEFRVIGYDYIGHGKNTSKEDYTLDNLVDELNQLFLITSTKQAHLCCLCFGGNIANVFAAKYPDKVLSICHIGGSINGDNKYSRTFREILNSNGSDEDFLLFYAEKFYEDDPMREDQRKIMIIHASMIRPEIMRTSIGIRANYNMRAVLASIKIPMLYVFGEFDQLFLACIPDLKKTVHQIKIELLPKASHVAHIFQPEMFQNMYQKFLNEQKVSLTV